MTTEPLADVKANLSRYIDRAEREHERVTITRNGRPAAVLIAVSDLQALEETLAVLADSEAMRDLADAEAAHARGEYTGEADMTAIMLARAEAERG